MKKLILVVIAVLIAAAIFTGCNGGTTSSTVQIGLEMQNLKYCTQINGDRDYTEKTDKTFAPGQTFYVYFEVKNLKTKKENGKLVYHPIVYAQVNDPDGKVAIQKTKVVDSELKTIQSAQYLYFPINITLPNSAPDGKYTLILEIKDGNGSGHIKSTSQFFIKKDT